MSIKDAIRKSGYTVRQVARELGVSEQAVYSWDRDKRPSDEHMRALENLLGKDGGQLHGLSGPDQDLLIETWAAVRHAMVKHGVEMAPRREAELAANFYRQFVQNGRVDQKFVCQVIEVMA